MRSFFTALLLVCLSFTVYAAGGTKRQQAASLEEQRSTAIKHIEEFEKTMKESDPNHKHKLEMIASAMPVVAALPPSQWESQIKFLYSALTEIDKKEKESDPYAVLSVYYPDEEKRTPNNLLQLPASEREKLFWARIDELEKLLDSGTLDLTEHAARMLSVALIYYPNWQRYIELRRYKLNLALQLKMGLIDQPKFDTLWSIKRREYDDKQAQQNVATQDAVARQQSEENKQRWSNAFGSIADGIRAARPAPSMNCTSSAIGGTVYTNCR